MSRARLRVPAFATVALSVALGAACGGSSSESPWPVEPIETDSGPAGEKLERGNVIATEDLPDNYGKGGGAPAAEDTELQEE